MARYATTYVYYMIPGLLCYNYQIVIARYFMTQRQVKYGMYCNVIATVFHVTIACILVLKYDMNIHGVGIASSVQFIVRFLVSYILLKTDPKFNVNL